MRCDGWDSPRKPVQHLTNCVVGANVTRIACTSRNGCLRFGECLWIQISAVLLDYHHRVGPFTPTFRHDGSLRRGKGWLMVWLSAHAIIRQFPFPGLRLRTAQPAKRSPASAALSNLANSFGVLYPKLLCGRSSLYSIRHAAIFRRASNRF